jgi:hypothetical protein
MGLRVWNLLLDDYDHEQLANNWAKVDAHDHSPGRGVLIPTEGIANEAISYGLLAGSVFPEVSGTAGSMMLEANEGKTLAGGPTLTVPETGTYEIGLMLTAYGEGEQPIVSEGIVCVNGTPDFALFFHYAPKGGRAQATNFAREELAAGDELTVECVSSNTSKVTFEQARISIWRVA